MQQPMLFPPRTKHSASTIALMAVVFAVYWQVHDFSFLSWDDDLYVTSNPLVREGLTLTGFVQAFVEPSAANYHPLTLLSHMLDVSLFGLKPGGHHLVNVVWHVLNTLLVLTLLHRLTGQFWRSLAVAFFFALHPLHVESVAWISARKDVLFLAFAMLSLLAWTEWLTTRRKPWYAASLMLFLLSLLSKPMAVVIPFCMLLLDYWPLARTARTSPASGRDLLKEKIPFFTLSVIFGAITLAVQSAAGATHDLVESHVAGRFTTALLGYTAYLRQIVTPDDLHYLYLAAGDITWGRIAASVTLIAGITAVALTTRRRHPYILFGWLWFILTLLPVSGLLQTGSQIHADRYTYLALTGPFIAIVWFACDQNVRSRVLVLASAPLVAVMVAITWMQIGSWQDDVTLYGRALEVNPKHSQAHVHFALHYLADDDLDRAETHARLARISSAGDARQQFTEGLIHFRRGRTAVAIESLRSAEAAEPTNPLFSYQTALIQQSAGNSGEAIAAYQRSLRHVPRNVRASLAPGRDAAAGHFNLAALHEHMGNTGAAIASLSDATAIRPEWELAWRRLSRLLLEAGRTDEGRAALAAADRIAASSRPGSAEVESRGPATRR